MTRTLLLTFFLILGAPYALSAHGPTATGDQAPAAADLEATSDTYGVRLVRINCDRGQTLTRGLRHLGRELLIQFQGTCEEDVLIDRDYVTVRGVGEDPTVIGTLTTVGAHHVLLEDFSVRNTPNSGIEIFEGSVATLQRLTVEDAGNRCINVRHSEATLSDLSTARCGSVGLVIRGSHALVTGDLINNESPFGFSVTEASNAFVRGAALIANNNTFIGVLSQLSSSLALVEGSSVVANDNGVAGIQIAANGELNFFDSPIQANNNGSLGLWLLQFGQFGPFSGTSSPLELSGNGLAGALVEKRSYLELGPETLLVDNLFAGLLISDSSAELTDITVRDNPVLDISLRFDAKVTFFGEANDIGLPVDCDDTVLTRGAFACDAAAALDRHLAPSWLSRTPPSPAQLP